MIRRSGERGSRISVLAARHDDDDDDKEKRNDVLLDYGVDFHSSFVYSTFPLSPPRVGRVV